MSNGVLRQTGPCGPLSGDGTSLAAQAVSAPNGCQGLVECTRMRPIKAGAWGLSPSLDRRSGHTTVLGGEHSSAEARQPTRKELLGSSNESMGAIVFLPSVEPIATRLGAVGMVWR